MGIDPHKKTHTAVVDGATGAEVGQLTVKARAKGHSGSCRGPAPSRRISCSPWRTAATSRGTSSGSWPEGSG